MVHLVAPLHPLSAVQENHESTQEKDASAFLLFSVGKITKVPKETKPYIRMSPSANRISQNILASMMIGNKLVEPEGECWFFLVTFVFVYDSAVNKKT